MLYFAALSDRMCTPPLLPLRILFAQTRLADAVSMLADDPQYDKLTDIVRSWRVKTIINEVRLTRSPPVLTDRKALGRAHGCLDR